MLKELSLKGGRVPPGGSHGPGAPRKEPQVGSWAQASPSVMKAASQHPNQNQRKNQGGKKGKNYKFKPAGDGFQT